MAICAFLFMSAAYAQDKAQVALLKKQVDSIQHTRQHDTLKINALIDLNYDLAFNANIGVLYMADRAISLVVAKEDQPYYRKALSKFYTAKGVYYQFTGHYNLAETWFIKVLKLGDKYNDDPIRVRAWANLGNVATHKGDYSRAAEYGIKVLHVSEKEGKPVEIAGDLGNLANAYVRLKLYNRAIKLLQRAIPLAAKAQDKRLEANLYNSMATAYGELKQSQLELNYTLKAYHIYKEIENPKGIGTTALNLGMVWENKRDYVKALGYLQESIKASRELEDNQNLAEAFQSVARINQAQGKLTEAAAIRDLAIANSEIAGDRFLASALYQEKAALLYKLGDFKNGYNYLERHRKLNDSLLNADINNKVAEMEVKYQTEKKASENRELQARNRLILYCSVLGIIALTIVFLLFYRNRLAQQRFTEEAKLSKAVFETEQNERIRIARDLHDSIGQMLSVIKMRLSDNEANNPAVDLVDQTIDEVRTISHNLLPEALNFGLIPALEDLCQRSSVADTVTVDFEAADTVRGHQFSLENQLSIYRVLQEVLSAPLGRYPYQAESIGRKQCLCF